MSCNACLYKYHFLSYRKFFSKRSKDADPGSDATSVHEKTIKENYWDKHPKWETSNTREAAKVDAKYTQPAPTTQKQTVGPQMCANAAQEEALRDTQCKTMRQPKEGSSTDRHPPKVPSLQSKSPPPPLSRTFAARSRAGGVKPLPPPPPFCQCAGILTGQRSTADHPPCMKAIIPTRP